MERGRREGLSEALDQAITQLNTGEGIEEALDAHPQHARALDPLLQAAAALQAEAATPLPPELEAWLPIGERDFAAIAQQMLSQPATPQPIPTPRLRKGRRAGRFAAPEIALILDDALDRMAGGASVEDCIEAYPQHAHDLASLLHTAAALRVEAATPLPPELEAWLPHGAHDFAVIAERMAPSYARRRSAILRNPSVQRAAIAAALVIAMMGLADNVAAQSIPGEPLYAWKRAKEDITLSLTSDPNEIISLHASYAERRLNELKKLTEPIEPVDPSLVAEATQSLVDHVEAAITEAQQTGNADTGPIAQIIDRSRSVLPQAANAAPEASGTLLGARDQLAALAPQVPPPPVVLGPTAETQTASPTDTATAPAADGGDGGGPVASGATADTPNDNITPAPGQPTPTPSSDVPIDPATPTSSPVFGDTEVPTDLPAGTPTADTGTPVAPTSDPDDNPPPPDATNTPLPPSATHTPLPPTNTAVPTEPPTPTRVPTEPPSTTPQPPPTQRPTETRGPRPPTRTPTPTRPPTNTPVTPTNTEVPPTNTEVPPTNTEVPSNTPVTPTDTEVPSNTPVTPTDTEVPPTNTEVPTDTPVTPADTALPIETPTP